jgi:hypothetical protein
VSAGRIILRVSGEGPVAVARGVFSGGVAAVLPQESAMRRLHSAAALALVSALVPPALAQTPLGPAFTYQGRLTQSGQPLSAPVNLVVRLYDAPTAGNLLGTQTLSNVPVAGGLLTVTLNSAGELGAAAFDGNSHWLEMVVNGTTLFPRQRLTAAPYASLARTLAFPLTANTDVSTPALSITNAAGVGLAGTYAAPSGVDLSSIGRSGLWGDSDTGHGVVGSSSALYGSGVVGKSNNVGVYGTNPTGGAGVYGDSVSGTGVYGQSSTATGIRGASVAITGTAAGIWGSSSAPSGRGVLGVANGVGAIGVHGTSVYGSGVKGQSTSGDAADFISTDGVGVASESTNNVGVLGTSSNDTGIAGFSTNGSGVTGQTDAAYGVAGIFVSASGVDLSTIGHSGVWGDSSTSHGVIGTSGALYGSGVVGKSNNVGVYGTNPTGGAGIYGDSVSGKGVYGTSTGGYGVFGVCNGGNGSAVRGERTSATGSAISASASGGAEALSVVGTSGSRAAYFFGSVFIQGNLSKSSGSFTIDHPLDPANKYFSHSFVESPDMMNIYNGNVTTDEHGYATITMPEWFQALNQDFRYQLTILDDADTADFVEAKVVRRIQDNRFTIRTSRPRADVSWLVTGIRHDAWAEHHRVPIEEPKSDADRGKYLVPEAFGMPVDQRIGSPVPATPVQQPPCPLPADGSLSLGAAK